MSECPRCSLEIGFSTLCSCGWKARKKSPFSDTEPAQQFHCHTDNCPNPAIMRKTMNGLIVNTCERCWESYRRQESIRGLKEKGLERFPDESQAQHTLRMRQWFKSHFPAMQAFDIKPAREPGEDEDYIHETPLTQ